MINLIIAVFGSHLSNASCHCVNSAQRGKRVNQSVSRDRLWSCDSLTEKEAIFNFHGDATSHLISAPEVSKCKQEGV